MATTIIAITHDDTQSAATVANRVIQPAAQPALGCHQLGDELHAIAGGLRKAQVVSLVESGDETHPSATVTLGGANLADGDTLDIAGVQLEWQSSPSGESEVDFINTAATDAAALAAAINAHSALSGMVTASAAGAVVTITGVLPGNICRYALQKSETNAGAMALSAASLGGVTSAVEATPRTYSRGV